MFKINLKVFTQISTDLLIISDVLTLCCLNLSFFNFDFIFTFVCAKVITISYPCVWGKQNNDQSTTAQYHRWWDHSILYTWKIYKTVLQIFTLSLALIKYLRQMKTTNDHFVHLKQEDMYIHAMMRYLPTHPQII